ncbi:PKD domain-containing protein [Photobacterium minamisatsumaniensis]|uniref:PKD domain-containing protein n=1 Tax=Photobacterium minamisatsumaniensis TaxID=2910233 RepID=UPI003D0F9B03
MKRAKRFSFYLYGLLFPLMSDAVVINEDIFEQNGGDINNIKQSIKFNNEKLRDKSYEEDYLSVGRLYPIGCSATWLGSDDLGWTYILTAAHCVEYNSEVTSVNNAKFISWDGREIAKGSGVIFVPSERINRPDGFGGASTDISIVKIPTNDILTDKNGQLVSPPIINDKFNELNKKVEFVGYGIWGVGLNSSSDYNPYEGDRRLYGESVITNIIENNHGIVAKYEPKGESNYWARVSSGDSGSAWWQVVKELKVIVATTNGGNDLKSTGARTSKYSHWIKNIYEDVKLLSEVENNNDISSLASAGADMIYPLEKGSSYYLDGTLSKGDALTYIWKIKSVKGAPEEAINLKQSKTATPELKIKNNYEVNDDVVVKVKLTIKNANGEKDSDVVKITLKKDNVNTPPIARAKSSLSQVTYGDSFELKGAKSVDADGDSLNYEWSQISGESVVLSNTGQANILVNTRSLTNKDQVLTFELTVSDGVAESTDTVSVSVEPNDESSIDNGGSTEGNNSDYTYPDGIGKYIPSQTVVLSRDGNTYQCRPLPEGNWCNINSPLYYEPGYGLAWQDAWEKQQI